HFALAAWQVARIAQRSVLGTMFSRNSFPVELAVEIMHYPIHPTPLAESMGRNDWQHSVSGSRRVVDRCPHWKVGQNLRAPPRSGPVCEDLDLAASRQKG